MQPITEFTARQGTTFILYSDENRSFHVQIVRHDQPVCSVPVFDLWQFSNQCGFHYPEEEEDNQEVDYETNSIINKSDGFYKNVQSL